MTEPSRHPRNDGMTVVKRTTRWFAVGGVAATGLFAGVAAASNAGHTNAANKAPGSPTTSDGSATSRTTSTPSSESTTTSPSSPQSQSSPQFQPPATAPANVDSGGAVVSGGS